MRDRLTETPDPPSSEGWGEEVDEVMAAVQREEERVQREGKKGDAGLARARKAAALVRARDMVARREYLVAERMLQDSLMRDPSDVETLCAYAGMLRVELNRPAEGDAMLEMAARLDPGHAAYLREQGAYLYQRGRVAEACGPLEAAFAADPTALDTRCLLGRALARRGEEGDGERARAMMERAVALSPEQAEAWRAKGEAAGASSLLRLTGVGLSVGLAV
eukprot:292254-Rhodomonas_salina.2